MPLGIEKVTPTAVKRWRDAFIGLFAGLIPFANDLAPVIHLTTNLFSTFCALGILLSHFGAKLFGLSDDEAIEQLQGKINKIKSDGNTQAPDA